MATMHLPTMLSIILLLAISMARGPSYLHPTVLTATQVAAVSLPRDQITAKGKNWTVTGDMVFKGKVGGRYIEHNGTIQDVFARVAKLNPGFNPKPTDISSNHTKAILRSELEQRQDSDAYVAGHFCCPVPGQWFDRTDRNAAWGNINYLRYGVDGWCGVNFGPGNCVRVASTHDDYLGDCSVILLCNDDQWFKNFDCGYVANLAADVVNMCGYSGDYSRWTCGQEFVSTYSHRWLGTGNINVIVTRQDCGAPGGN